MVGVASALIGGVLGAGGSALNTYLSQLGSKNLMDYQNKLNIQNWQMQNEYNLPINQIQRLKDAGLNPNLVYGSGTSTIASAPASSSIPNFRASGLEKFGEAVSILGQMKQLDLQNKALEKDIYSKELDNHHKEFENLVQQLDFVSQLYGTEELNSSDFEYYAPEVSKFLTALGYDSTKFTDSKIYKRNQNEYLATSLANLLTNSKIDVNNSVIDVNGEKIDLIKAQKELVESQTTHQNYVNEADEHTLKIAKASGVAGQLIKVFLALIKSLK